jgi:hypothetical protein
MMAPVADDLPSLSGDISPALKVRLQREDLLDLESLLRVRGARTLQVLQSLCESERAQLMVQATKQWEIFHHFGGNITYRLSQLFVDVSTTGSLASTNRGVLGLPSSGSGSNSRAIASGEVALWPGLVQAMPAGQEATPGLVPQMPAAPVPVQPMLPQPLIHDTKLVKSLPGLFLAARDIIGYVRFDEAIRCIIHSNQLAHASYMWAMDALAALCVPKAEMNKTGRKRRQ